MMRIVWFLVLSVIWPLVHILVFVLRFQAWPQQGSWIFLPMGVLSALAFLWLWQRASRRVQRIGLIVGYLAASPIAFLGSLMGGLVGLPWGPIVYGSIPLLLGISIAYGLASLLRRKNSVLSG